MLSVFIENYQHLNLPLRRGSRVRVPHEVSSLAQLVEHRIQCSQKLKIASLAEWSNATDLRSVSFGSAGSNPARCNNDRLQQSNLFFRLLIRIDRVRFPGWVNARFANAWCLSNKTHLSATKAFLA